MVQELEKRYSNLWDFILPGELLKVIKTELGV